MRGTKQLVATVQGACSDATSYLILAYCHKMVEYWPKAKNTMALSAHYFFNIVQFIECLHGGEIVDIKTQNLVANLRKHGVV